MNKVMTSGELNSILREISKKQKQSKEVQSKSRGKTYLYFAYGSNMNMKQMAQRCPNSVPMFKATLHNAKMVFKYYADVESEKKKRSFVKGAVYEITKDCMKALDKYECCPKFYKKVKCVVQGPFDKYYEAFMYVMQPNVRALELPSEQYINTIAEGYIDWGIPTTTLCKAWEETAIQLGEIERMEAR